MNLWRAFQGRLNRLSNAQAALDQQIQKLSDQMEELSRRLDEVTRLLEETDPHRDQP